MNTYQEEVCPGAWLLNYSNPMAMLTGFMLRYTRGKTPQRSGLFRNPAEHAGHGGKAGGQGGADCGYQPHGLTALYPGLGEQRPFPQNPPPGEGDEWHQAA